jgi:hypothetical protein
MRQDYLWWWTNLAMHGHLLVFPKRFASFLLRLFSSNSDVLEPAIIHLQQLSPLPIALTA